MTLDLQPAAYLRHASEGEALWFSDALLSYVATGAETGGVLTVAEARAPRSAGSPRHRHLHEDEAWFVLDGELRFWLGDEERLAGAGTFVFGPRGIDHRFVVESEEARFLLLLTPAGFEDFTRACGWPATTRTLPPADLPPKDFAVLMAAAQRHGLEIVPDLQESSTTTTITTTQGDMS